jgi:uncharacterized protein
MHALEPFYFGEPPSSRFAVFHPTPEPASHVAVLCYPLGHEYVRAHRAYRNLAAGLVRAGTPTLRFDYLGSGDSSGDAPLGVSQWLLDIDAAIAEAKRRAGAQRVSLIGLRFGAMLASLAAVQRDDVETLVLWDPVLNGAEYLEELSRVQRQWLHDRLGADAEGALNRPSELIGLPVNEVLLAEIRRLELGAADRPSATRIHVVESTATERASTCVSDMRGRGWPVTYQHVACAGDWLNYEAVHQLLLPHEILKTIVDYVARPRAARA